LNREDAMGAKKMFFFESGHAVAYGYGAADEFER